VRQTLRQCNNTNIAHLTTDAFPVGFETHSLQLERSKEFLITLSQDMICKESSSAMKVAVPQGLCCCAWSVTPININGHSVCIRAMEKPCIKVGLAAVMGCEACFMYSIPSGFYAYKLE